MNNETEGDGVATASAAAASPATPPVEEPPVEEPRLPPFPSRAHLLADYTERLARERELTFRYRGYALRDIPPEHRDPQREANVIAYYLIHRALTSATAEGDDYDLVEQLRALVARDRERLAEHTAAGHRGPAAYYERRLALFAEALACLGAGAEK